MVVVTVSACSLSRWQQGRQPELSEALSIEIFEHWI